MLLRSFLVLVTASLVLGGVLQLSAQPANDAIPATSTPTDTPFPTPTPTPTPIPTSIPISEVLPVVPAVSAQRGFAVALDGDWLAVGAPLEEVETEDREVKRNAGAVHLFRFESGLWIERQRLISQNPEDNGRFGHSVALSADFLAVGAPGEAAVYVFIELEEKWFLQVPLLAQSGIRQFGQAVALDGGWLAIGAVEPEGQDGTGPGAIHLFQGDDGWEEVQPSLKGDPAKPDELFGHSVSLRGGTMVVGAPGADLSKGAAYVFELGETEWSRSARLIASDAAPGDQLGFSVAVEAAGKDIVAGAPAADASGAPNCGALYTFRAGEEWEDVMVGRLPVSGVDAGDRLGYTVAIDGDLLAASAPFGSADLSGAVHILARDGLSWRILDTVEADNAGIHDLFGFSATVRGGRVVAGAVLVDQGGSAAGSTYTFQCSLGAGCVREAELVATDEGPNDRFGVSIDADGDTLVVGSLRSLFSEETAGVVYVYRRAGAGWLQEARLKSPIFGAKDAFGLAVAISGDKLVVGAPIDFAEPDEADEPDEPSGDPDLTPSGSAYVFRKINGKWTCRACWTRLAAPSPKAGDGFGRSVAIDGNTVVVGATGGSEAAYVFMGGIAPGIPLPLFGVVEVDLFGHAVAVSGNTIAVGAPSTSGSVYLYQGSGQSWALHERESPGLGFPGHDFGLAVSVYGNTLLVGARGAVDIIEHDLGGWSPIQTLITDGVLFFGQALDFRGDAAVILGRGDDQTVVAHLFVRTKEGWEDRQVAKAFARPSLVLDTYPHFAAAVGSNFFAVTAPGSAVGDRVLIFDLPQPEVTE